MKNELVKVNARVSHVLRTKEYAELTFTTLDGKEMTRSLDLFHPGLPPILKALGVKAFEELDSTKGRLVRLACRGQAVLFINEVDQATGRPVWNGGNELAEACQKLTPTQRTHILALVKTMTGEDK